MSLDIPDRQGFMDAIAKEINAIKSIGTWSINEVVPQHIDKKLKGISKFVYAKNFILMVALTNIKQYYYIQR